MRASLGPDLPGRHLLQDTARLFSELCVVGIASRAEESLDLIVGEAFDEPCLAHGSIPAIGHDLLQDPLKALEGMIGSWKRVNGVLDRDGAQSLEAPPDLDPKVVRLRGDLMDQKEPARFRVVCQNGLLIRTKQS